MVLAMAGPSRLASFKDLRDRVALRGCRRSTDGPI